MWFWRLMVMAACASLLGLAASRLLGPRLPEMLWLRSQATGSGESVETSLGRDGGVAPDVVAEGMAAGMAPDPPPAAGTRRSARQARPAPARDQLADQLARGVRKRGDRRYEIKRGALELALRNLRSLSAWVRVGPEIRDGRASGFRVVSVTAGGPFAKLGLRRGDVLVSVNGLDIRTPDHALDAHGKLKSASRFALGFLRDGRAMVQEYAIR